MSPAGRLLLWSCIVVAMVIDLLSGSGPLTMLSDHMVHAAKQERRVSEVMCEHLWRRGEQWEDLNEMQRANAREASLSAIQGAERLTVLAGAPQGAATLRDTVNEVRLFVKMLEFDDGRYEEGMKGQGINEAILLHQASQRLHEQAWLERHLPPSTAETRAQAWFESHRTLLSSPECYRAAHLFLSAHEQDKPERAPEMQAIGQRLRNGEAFEALSAKFSEDERTKLCGGDLGWFSAVRMPADFMAAVKDLKPGEVTGVVRTKLGWHVIKLLETKPASEVRYEDVKAEIIAKLANQDRAQAVRAFMPSH